MKFKHARSSKAIVQTLSGIRKQLGMDQVQFGTLLNVHRNTVSRYELGQITPSARVLLQVLTLAKTREERDVLEEALRAQGINLSTVVQPEIIPAAAGSDHSDDSRRGGNES